MNQDNNTFVPTNPNVNQTNTGVSVQPGVATIANIPQAAPTVSSQVAVQATQASAVTTNPTENAPASTVNWLIAILKFCLVKSSNLQKISSNCAANEQICA